MFTWLGRGRGLRQQRFRAGVRLRAAFVAMSASATAGTTTCPCWWPAARRRPDTCPRRPIAADISVATRTSPSACAGHQPSGRRSFRKQRTVNPLTRPARYNFLYSSSRPAPRAASGRPPARQRHGGHRGTDLTLHTPGSKRIGAARKHPFRQDQPICHPGGHIPHTLHQLLGGRPRGGGQRRGHVPQVVEAESLRPKPLHAARITTRIGVAGLPAPDGADASDATCPAASRSGAVDCNNPSKCSLTANDPQSRLLSQSGSVAKRRARWIHGGANRKLPAFKS
jgi:hypothetical protein